ncbi:MAG TPA: type II toxin-antitoxin system VapC family toxin [Verrucomicrobiota bacterium]|nr:type II toxin-antitoxin system VapC family toxin [Verrucomicrobiota bacterium]HNU51185.1 type II toxin-antitoxin system VapC family toxin [Verrucomicrobiota bacterium]
MSAAAWVFDCSAVMALVLGDERGDEVESILRLQVQARATILVPAVFWFEVANTLVMAGRRGRLSRSALRLAESDLAALPIVSEPPPDAFIRERIREAAEEYELTAYDAAYLECAERNGRRLKTLDRDLLGLLGRCNSIA